MGGEDYAELKVKPSVVLTGAAKESIGPSIGTLDIGASPNAFLFRVALPSIKIDQSKLKCEVQRNGKVTIQGMVTQGTEVLRGLSKNCEMRNEMFCSPGPFTISFTLPGPVDPRLFSPTFRPDGILEVVVLRNTRPSDPADAWAPPS